MHRSAPAAAALTVLLLAAAPPVHAQRQADAAQAAGLVLAQANALRQREGLAPLAPQPALEAAAREFADYMARTDRYAHDADGRRPADRAEAAGYAYCTVAENIAWQFHSAGIEAPDLARRLVQGWERSPPHRANLLDAGVTETGVAVARSARTGRWYGVQMFGRPESARVDFAIGNATTRPVRYELDGRAWRLAPRETRRHGQCSAPQVTVELARGPQRLAPRGGEHWVVERDGRLHRASE